MHSLSRSQLRHDILTMNVNGCRRKSLERTTAPLRSSRVGGCGDALWFLRVSGIITVGRLSLSSAFQATA
jgi:hypothetical protein